jgi:hypothetical protein
VELFEEPSVVFLALAQVGAARADNFEFLECLAPLALGFEREGEVESQMV